MRIPLLVLAALALAPTPDRACAQVRAKAMPEAQRPHGRLAAPGTPTARPRFGAWLEAGPGFGTPGATGVAGVGLRLHPVTLGVAYAKSRGSGELRETRYTELAALFVGVQRWRANGSVSIEAGPALVDRWEEDDCDADAAGCDERRLDLGDALGPAIRLSGTFAPWSWFGAGLAGIVSFSDEFDAVIYVYVRVGAFP